MYTPELTLLFTLANLTLLTQDLTAYSVYIVANTTLYSPELSLHCIRRIELTLFYIQWI